VHLSTFTVKVMNYHGYYIMLFGYVPQALSSNILFIIFKFVTFEAHDLSYVCSFLLVHLWEVYELLESY
jgi:hypothetical protein